MPANLNALIRYKTIDWCLTNRHRQWTIHDLIEKCSEALEEFRGIYKTISERTIRDDIRVMRSDILGFNAPIEFRDGYYSYSDPAYTIFNIRVTDTDLLEKILAFLVEIRTEISHPELEKIIESLSKLIPLPSPGAVPERSALTEEDLEMLSSEGEAGAPSYMKIPPIAKRVPVHLSLKTGRKDIVSPKISVHKPKEPTPGLFEWGRVLKCF